MIRMRLFFAACLLFILSCASEKREPPSILVFSKTETVRHASIPAGIEALRRIADAGGYRVEFTEDAAWFSEERLKGFSAVVFLNTSGDVLDNWQQADFQRYIEAGGGFVGIHGAAGTEYDWLWYGKLVGAYASGHSATGRSEIQNIMQEHPACQSLPATWEWEDAWYVFRPVPPVGKVWVDAPNTLLAKERIGPLDSLRQMYKHIDPRVAWTSQGHGRLLSPDVKVLLNHTLPGVGNVSQPLSWCHEYEGGRAFYTAIGHASDHFSDSLFLSHLSGGIRYAIGDNQRDYRKAKTHRIPPDERFVRTILAANLDEPMELEIFPDNRVLVIERKGAIKLYDPQTDTLETVCHFPVYHEFEEGLLGVALDPGWEENRWIYLYYSLYDSLKVDGRRNRLSRFRFDGNMLHVSSEKMLLEVPEEVGCCHAGGSIEFGPEGYLYISTGDNTNPFESDGFAPVDERTGRQLWDAQRSAANPNDLRGKILRIKPEIDGSYSIPGGNLFPPGTPGTKPEIYVMGCRNPFRISVDSRTGCLFWGDVGPDAGKDGRVRGPKGYDTINRACEAGNYGWPYVRGNHIYQDYDFRTRKPGTHFDPEAIINDSPNNTGARELPLVRHPLIWYSYDESTEFPWTGTGGKNPMAGPVFHASPWLTSGQDRIQFPPYFEDKLLVYEWMRNWIYVVTLDASGQYVQADPFLSGEKFVRPMDMAFGPDGALYILEYGEAWFARNPDARLNRIEYAPGNRRPLAKIEAGPLIGADPLTVHFSGTHSVDHDGDKLSYTWTLTGGHVRSDGPAFTHTFTYPGIYEVVLQVTDEQGLSNRAITSVLAGNEAPGVSIELDGNRTFYWDDSRIQYEVFVSDTEDGSLSEGTINPNRVSFSIDYLKEGKDLTAVIQGHQSQGMSISRVKHAGGKVLMDGSDCGTCHAENRKINGPGYIEIANRYAGDEFAVQRLAKKVIQGGGGAWGETAMSAHPQLSQKEAEEIVQYILSLAGEWQSGTSLPLKGSYHLIEHLKSEEKGVYILQAGYLDKGHINMPSLPGRQTLILRYPRLEAESATWFSRGLQKLRYSDSDTMLVSGLMHNRFLGFEEIDLTGVGAVQFHFFEADSLLRKGTGVEIMLGKETGEIAGKGKLTVDNDFSVPIRPVTGKHNVYFVFTNERSPEEFIGLLDWIYFKKDQKK